MKRNQMLRNLLILAVVLVVGIVAFICLGRKQGKNEKNAAQTEQKEDTNEEKLLSGRVNDSPTGLNLGDSLADIELETESGEAFSIGGNLGKYTVVTFWGSWCEYCKEQLEQMESYKSTAEKYNASFLLVGVINEEKTPEEELGQVIEAYEIDVPSVIDRDGKVYKKLGIQKLPTNIVLSPEGRVMAIFPGKIDNAAQLDSMLSYVTKGFDTATLEAADSILTNDEGGIQTSTEEEKTHPSGADVLSESQGLVMEYAAETGNKDLFDRAFAYAEKSLGKDGLFLWYGSDDSKTSSNAFLDDLRIYGALLQAEKQWGKEYEKAIEEHGKALCRYNVTAKNEPLDFYDFKEGKSTEFSLCYGDLETIKELEKRTGTKGLYEKTKAILTEGYISDDFPLYYASWSYKEKKYSKKDLNMAEAVYTLYHLAKEGLLKDESKDWLLEQLKGDGIMAGYGVDGSVSEGYESTGIYALTAMIGMECNNSEMVTLSIARMNEFRIFDSANRYNGAFGNADGSGIYSFDQCMALKAYTLLESYCR